jgi:hypothetical protein
MTSCCRHTEDNFRIIKSSYQDHMAHFCEICKTLLCTFYDVSKSDVYCNGYARGGTGLCTTHQEIDEKEKTPPQPFDFDPQKEQV